MSNINILIVVDCKKVQRAKLEPGSKENPTMLDSKNNYVYLLNDGQGCGPVGSQGGGLVTSCSKNDKLYWTTCNLNIFNERPSMTPETYGISLTEKHKTPPIQIEKVKFNTVEGTVLAEGGQGVKLAYNVNFSIGNYKFNNEYITGFFSFDPTIVIIKH